MSGRWNHLVSLCDLILPCMNFITGSFGRSDPSGGCEIHSKNLDSYLPSSIILEILLKLPIKSIIRFRWVCKTWNNLISEKYFATLYFKNPPFNVLVKSEFRLVEDRYDHILESFGFLEIGWNGDVMHTPFNPKALNIQKSGWVLEPIYSCNGLLCLVHRPLHEDLAYVFNNEVIYIMNPILGEVIMLPQVNRTENTENVVCGFHFSTQSDHYKVVRFVRKNDGHVHGEIFTIGVDHKWRCFEDSSLPFLSFYCGITCNGVLYFAGYEECLYAFEIEEEKGHLIPLPYEFGDHMNYIIFITACNDNICLADSTSEHQVVIWTLKRYGVVESWSREIILKSWISFDLHHDRLLPITTLRNGDLLMLRHESLYEDKGLISYDRKTKECRKITDGEGAHVLFFEYSPSFFPLNTVLWKDVCI